MLNILDEFTYESLGIRVARRLKAIDVIDGSPVSSSCAACPATFVPTMALSSWPRRHTGQPLGNGYIESFPSARRVVQWRNIVHAQGGEDRDRKLAPSLQHRAASRLLGLSCTGAEANA
jgi:hypothetical protein